jgi:hypothetical protein
MITNGKSRIRSGIAELEANLMDDAVEQTDQQRYAIAFYCFKQDDLPITDLLDF